MKTNTMMRVASVLLVAVLLSTCVISGTFAKYTTSGTSNDEARVAKWGVEITANSDTMFKKSYDVGDQAVTVKTDVTLGDKNLVAPGTEGTLTDVTLSGKPEVSVNVSYVATVTLTGWNIDPDGDSNTEEYFPIIFTVEGQTYGMTNSGATNESASISDLQTAVKTAIENCRKDYEVNTDLSTKGSDAPSVSWAWTFEAATGNTYQTNVKDTALGDLNVAPTIEVSIVTTVTQTGD